MVVEGDDALGSVILESAVCIRPDAHARDAVDGFDVLWCESEYFFPSRSRICGEKRTPKEGILLYKMAGLMSAHAALAAGPDRMFEDALDVMGFKGCALVARPLCFGNSQKIDLDRPADVQAFGLRRFDQQIEPVEVAVDGPRGQPNLLFRQAFGTGKDVLHSSFRILAALAVGRRQFVQESDEVAQVTLFDARHLGDIGRLGEERSRG